MPHDGSNPKEQGAPRAEQGLHALEQRVVELERERLSIARAPNGVLRPWSGETPLACSNCAESTRRADEAEAQFRSLFSEAFEGLAISVNGKIVLANPALAVLGRCDPAEIVGKNVLDLTTPSDGVRALQRIRSGDRSPYELTAVRPDGSSFPCEVLGRNISYGGGSARLTSFRDLTQRKEEERARQRFEERLQQAQKLENLGTIAAGVAHDFNNLLLVVQGHAELARAHASPQVAEHLGKIHAAAQAAVKLTEQMLTFAGHVASDREAIQLGCLVREVAAMLQASLGEVIIDTRDIVNGLPTVFADRAQMKQLTMNLLLNAVEAVAGSGRGVFVRLREVECSVHELHEMVMNAAEQPGRFVELEVRDEGCGMTNETLTRIFDPFFSTKFQGRGLGLASVLGIVRAHAGAIDVESAPGRGSRFSLLFPLARS